MPRTRIVSDAGDGPEEVTGAPASVPTEEGSRPVADQSRPTPAAELARHEHYAGHLRTTSAAMFHHAAMAPRIKGIDSQAYMIYHDRLLADCGNPSDPIEQMLIEQLGQAHFCLGLLFAKTSNAGQVEAVGIYGAAAARLMGEFRRTSLALQAYRAASRQLAHDPTKDIVIPDGRFDRDDDAPGKNCANDEKETRSEELDADNAIIPYPEPAACGQGSSAEEVPAQPRRARKAPRRRSGGAAVGEDHRTANG
jgi:hypothetical protein